VAEKRGKFRQVIDPILAKALTHKVRGATLLAFGEWGVASPKEVADFLELELTEVSYHVRKLKSQGMIRLVRTERRRGFHEHFYELAKPILLLDDEEWTRLPQPIQDRLSGSLLQTAMTEAVDALKAGTFNSTTGHQSRMAMPVDEQGHREAMGVLGDALERLREIEKGCAKRLKLPSSEAIPLSVFMLGFESAGRAGRRKSDGGPDGGRR
jgi:DNA-binding transcriptional ArsR family regulator